MDCGESNVVVLDFDHQGNKKSSIADLYCGGSSLKKIQNEIKKCEVVCKNCHYIRTAKQLNHPRYRFAKGHSSSH